ncbi:EamA domain-containing protein [Rubrivivax sp. A210]|uniref:DMT family transporter n=1 Tax=Rubrivivax sp. A210 TaxID=2772301 RepID=UPI0019195BE2|nr:DMT family transporter [Rubrivivax sp. A210]CAD5370237.1 EamA domain-containing protein [Rubrivivax sp. A210]
MVAAADLRPAPAAGRLLGPALALVCNAFVWGVSWWPFRELQALGLHPLWATALIYLVSALAITLWRPQSWRQLLGTPSLWWLVLASGATNATFNWAVTVGDVVRVVLLFYLMPLWAVLLARLLLGEAFTPAALLRVALALAGAAIVLWPAGGGLPLPRTLAEGLGVAGGFAFALNNVLLRREAHRPEAARALAMFMGGAVVSAAVALAAGGSVPPPPAPALAWVGGALALAVAFLASNLALQYGAARLPANVTAVVMISEVLFASVSAALLGAGTLTTQLLLGGALIVGATLLAARG